MQKTDTSTIDAKAVIEKPKLTKLLDIAVDENQMLYVNWPTDKKDFCITALAEAIKLVTMYQKPVIEQAKPNLMDFLKGVKR